MNDLSPKEVYEQKKKEKISMEIKGERTKTAKRIFIWLIAVLLVVGGIYWLVKKSQEKISSRKIFAIQIADQGRSHIDVGAVHPDYNSNPPTSGWHYEEWETKGVYKTQQPDEGLVHNLEHGYIWISYRPDANPEIIKQLENFYGFGNKIIIEPRKENDKLIAIAAWNWLDKFDPASGDSLNDAELNRIGDFIDEYINRGPEPGAL